MSSKDIVTNFAVHQSVEAFYTGGLVQVTKDAQLLYTTCDNSIHVLDVNTGATKFILGSQDDVSSVSCFSLSPDECSVVISYSNLLLRQFAFDQEKPTLVRTWKSQHRSPVLVLEFGQLSDSEVLASGGADFVIKIWHLQLQYCTHTLRGANAVITCLKFSPNHGILYAASADGQIKVWDLTAEPGKRCKSTLSNHSSPVTSLIICDNDTLISASRDQTVTIWNSESFSKIKTVPLFEAVECFEPLFVKPDLECLESKDEHNLYLSGGDSGLLKIQSLDKGRSKFDLKLSGQSGARIEQIISCPLANTYCCVTSDQNIIFIDSFRLVVKKQFVGFNDEILDTCFVGKDERYLAVAVNTADCRLYDTNDLSCSLLHGHTDSVLSVDCAIWQPNLFATGSKDNSIRIWSLDSDTSTAHQVAVGTGHTSAVAALKFSKLKARFLVSGSYDTTLKLWVLPDKEKMLQSGEHLKASCTVIAHRKDITCVDVSPNDQLIATGSLDKTVELWKVEFGNETSRLVSAGKIIGNKRGVWDVCFSPNDQVLATAGGDCNVRIFALTDRSCVKTFQGHDAAVLRIYFLPNGQQLISSDGGGLVKLWNVRANECTKTFEAHEHKAWALNFTKDGKRMVSGGGDAKLLIWKDVSETEKLETEKRKAQEVEHEQQLANLVQRKLYAEALKMALKLDRPFNALKILGELITKRSDDSDSNFLKSAIILLNDAEVGRLLEYVAEWNTNSRNSQISQEVLYQVLHIYSPVELLKLPNMVHTVEALLPYTKRHFDRLSKLRQQSCFLDYTWQKIRLEDK